MSSNYDMSALSSSDDENNNVNHKDNNNNKKQHNYENNHKDSNKRNLETNLKLSLNQIPPLAMGTNGVKTKETKTDISSINVPNSNNENNKKNKHKSSSDGSRCINCQFFKLWLQLMYNNKSFYGLMLLSVCDSITNINLVLSYIDYRRKWWSFTEDGLLLFCSMTIAICGFRIGSAWELFKRSNDWKRALLQLLGFYSLVQAYKCHLSGKNIKMNLNLSFSRKKYKNMFNAGSRDIFWVNRFQIGFECFPMILFQGIGTLVLKQENEGSEQSINPQLIQLSLISLLISVVNAQCTLSFLDAQVCYSFSLFFCDRGVNIYNSSSLIFYLYILAPLVFFCAFFVLFLDFC